MGETLSEESKVENRLGIWKELSEVPETYRLHQYSSELAGRDVYGEWIEETYDPDWGERWVKNLRRAGEYWKEFMDARGRHHALATPTHVEEWMGTLHESRKVSTVCNCYYIPLKRFYTWMVWNWEYPHRYNPVLMAIGLDGIVSEAQEHNDRDRT